MIRKRPGEKKRMEATLSRLVSGSKTYWKGDARK